jgi:hypothetical protein
MSAPQNLTKRTQILIKDLPFQEEYKLSHTQTDLMAYLANVPYWATEINGYFIIATSKIMRDMPMMGEKTIIASFKVLREKNLIHTTTVVVENWRGKPCLRGIRLTYKGQKYNQNLILPSQDKEVKRLKKELKELRSNYETLKNKKNQELIEPKEEETKGLKAEVKIKEIPTVLEPKKEIVDEFKEKVTKIFAKNQKLLCNGVDTWNKKSIFYINSYSRLCIITPEKNKKQLTDPSQIHQFWNWLLKNNERVGNIIDWEQAPTLQELKTRYLNKNIEVNDKKWKIHNIVANNENELVKLQIRNQENKIALLTDNRDKSKFFTLKRCQEIILEVVVL